MRCDGKCTSRKTYRGKDVTKDFTKFSLKEQADINRALNPLPLSEPVIGSDICWTCKKPIYLKYPINCQCSKPQKPNTIQLEDYYKHDKGFTKYK